MYVYLITNLINDKKYVGITNNIKRRWSNHCHPSKGREQVISNAIKKYGVDNFKFEVLEENGITIPVLGVNCTYKYHVTFADTLLIKVFVTEYTGVRMTVSYEITDKKTGKTVMEAETKHCFTNRNLKPINLKKHAPEFSKKFESTVESKEK